MVHSDQQTDPEVWAGTYRVTGAIAATQTPRSHPRPPIANEAPTQTELYSLPLLTSAANKQPGEPRHEYADLIPTPAVRMFEHMLPHHDVGLPHRSVPMPPRNTTPGSHTILTATMLSLTSRRHLSIHTSRYRSLALNTLHNRPQAGGLSCTSTATFLRRHVDHHRNFLPPRLHQYRSFTLPHNPSSRQFPLPQTMMPAAVLFHYASRTMILATTPGRLSDRIF